MTRNPLAYYLDKQYPFRAIADPDGGWTIEFPDLPGCVTVADTSEELATMAEDVRRGWIQVAYELGQDIPEPSYPEAFSGKLNVRLPKSLHRRLAEAAEDDAVSLNTLIVGLLERGLAGDIADRHHAAAVAAMQATYVVTTARPAPTYTRRATTRPWSTVKPMAA